MTEPQKSLEQRIREARSSQEISDIQKQQTGWVERTEGSVPASVPANAPWTSPVQSGRVRVYSERDGHVEIAEVMLPRALDIAPDLKITAVGSNPELEQRVAQCRDTAELALLLSEAQRGKI